MSSSSAYDLGVVIVDYFKSDAVVVLVKQIKKQYGCGSVQICVVDNSVDDNNFSKLKGISGIKLVKSESNIGYTRACNLGVSFLNSDFLAFINPDIQIKDNNLFQCLLDQLKSDHQKGIVGPQQINPDGSIEQSARTFPTLSGILAKRLPFFRTLFNKAYRAYISSYDLKRSQFVDWLQSSFIIVKSSDFASIGGFDEKYFLFMADVEISKSMERIGKRTYYCSDIVAWPDGKRASGGGLFSIFKSKAVRIHIMDYLKYLILK